MKTTSEHQLQAGMESHYGYPGCGALELARSRGKRAGVAIALSLAAVTSVPALAADTVVQAGETVSGGTLTNHDNQIVSVRPTE